MNKNLFKAIALLSILFGTMLLAVPVTGPVKTWTSGEILTSADLNSTINSLKAAIEGISTATATTASTATSTSTSVSSQWATNGTNISYTNGNVGIGTITPLGTLAVQGTGTGTGINFQTANSSGTPLVTALDNGRVGIGTSSPIKPLEIVSTTAGSLLVRGDVGYERIEVQSYLDPGIQTGRYRGTYTSKSAVQAGDVLGFYQAGGYDGSSQSMNSGNIAIYAEENFTPTTKGTYIHFNTTSLGTASRTEKMRITANGNVGIGTTSPAGKLTVTDNIEIRSLSSLGSKTILNFSNSFASGTTDSFPRNSIRIETGYSTGTWRNEYISFKVGCEGSCDTPPNPNNPIADRMLINGNGNVGIATIVPTEKLEVNGCIKHNNGTLGTSCSSDFRLKKDISNLVFTNVLNKISAMQPKKYKYKTGEPNVYLGLVAQDVEKVAPELVGTNKEGYKTLDYTSIQWMQFQAIKELKVQHDEEKSNNDRMISNLRESNGKFEKENAELKAANEALKKRLDKMERAIAAIEKRM